MWCDAFVKSGSFMSRGFSPGKLYGDPDYLEERHRHRFEVRM